MSEPTPTRVHQAQPFAPGPAPDHPPSSTPAVEAPGTAELAVKIDAAHRAATSAIQNALTNAVRCGELLIQAKSQVPHGEWLTWLQGQTKVSERTAQAYMRLARKLKSIDPQRVADLSVRDALAVISTPKPRPKPEPRSGVSPAAMKPETLRPVAERRTLPDMVGQDAMRRAESGSEHDLTSLKKGWRGADAENRQAFLDWLQDSGDVIVLGNRLSLNTF